MIPMKEELDMRRFESVDFSTTLIENGFDQLSHSKSIDRA